jgi:CheY-like chemotaxis protein
MTTKVLVVDDEIGTLDLLRTLLELTGFNPVTTLNSSEAITLAEIEDVDVALLDIMMPNIDGFELCLQMRRHEKLKQLPIIFVTAYDSLDLEDRRKAAGADFVVRKPIDIDQLTHVIEDLYAKRHSGELPIPKISPSTAELLAEKADDPHKQNGNGATSSETRKQEKTRSTSTSAASQATKTTSQRKPAATAPEEKNKSNTDNSSQQDKTGPVKPKRPPTPS